MAGAVRGPRGRARAGRLRGGGSRRHARRDHGPGRRGAGRHHRRRAGRFDFNLSFYAYLDGLELESAPRRRWGPPAHDQRGKHKLVGELTAPRGLGAVQEFEGLRDLAPPGPALKASVPGQYTLAGRIEHPDRYAVTELLIRSSLASSRRWSRRAASGSPWTSRRCPATRGVRTRSGSSTSSTARSPGSRRCYIGTHLCFGNFKGRAVGGVATRRCSRRSCACTPTSCTSRWRRASSPSSS